MSEEKGGHYQHGRAETRASSRAHIEGIYYE